VKLSPLCFIKWLASAAARVIRLSLGNISLLLFTVTYAMPPPPHSPSSSSYTPSTRLSQVSNHIMGSVSPQPAETLFNANVVPEAPEDPLFGLMAAYRKDTSDKKVDLGIGAYRDNNAKPWILPVVKKVCGVPFSWA
jgi:hypothetical protein